MVEFLFVLVMLALYLTPTLIAVWRRNPRTRLIFVVNLALGWTLVVWIGALIFALNQSGERTRRYNYSHDAYGGMQVSTAQHFNTGLLAACGGVLAGAAVLTLGLRETNVFHDDADVVSNVEAAPMSAGANSSQSSSASAIPYDPLRLRSNAQTSSVASSSGETAAKASPKRVIVQFNSAAAPQSTAVAPKSVPHNRPKHRARDLSQKFYVDGVPLSQRVPPFAR